MLGIHIGVLGCTDDVFITHVCRTQRKIHQIPVRRFLEAIFQTDLRSFFAENCFEVVCVCVCCVYVCVSVCVCV